MKTRVNGNFFGEMRDEMRRCGKFRGQTDPTLWENRATLSFNAELAFCESDRSVCP